MAQDTKKRHVKTVTSEELRVQLADLTDRVVLRNERMIVTRRGKEVMALVTIEDYELLEEALDTLEDRKELPIIIQRLTAYDETGESISLEQFEAELLD